MKQGKIMRALVLALAVSPAFAQTTTTAPPPGRPPGSPLGTTSCHSGAFYTPRPPRQRLCPTRSPTGQGQGSVDKRSTESTVVRRTGGDR